jgi:uncharacterized protein (TIGR04255 family)
MKPEPKMDDSTGSLEFGDLPLIEVAARIALDKELPDFKLAKLFKLKQALEKEFPIVEETPLFEMAAPPVKPPKLAPGTLIAVNFIADPPDVRVTVQPNLIKWAWTRTFEKNTNRFLDYPRYKRLREELSILAELTGNIFCGCALEAKSLNMGYTNFISTKGKTANETSERYLARNINSEIMGSSPTVHEISLNWRTSKGLDRKLHFAAGHSDFGSEQVEGYVLTTNVGGFVASGKDPIALLDEVHLDLQDFFLNIISDQAKKEWEYVERS